MSQSIFEYALKHTFIPMVIKPPFGTDSQWLTDEEQEEEIELNYCPVARQTNPVQVAHIENKMLLKCSDTQREREQRRALTKEGAATLTNGRFKFGGSTVSQTLRALCERRASRSRSLWSEQRRGMEGKREPWSREKEGGEKRERGRDSWRVITQPSGSDPIIPSRDLGPLPPTGPQTSAEWKISVEHPGNDPNTLRHTETHKQTLAQKTSRLQHSCPKNRIQYSYSGI